jgi:hypothetical protein
MLILNGLGMHQNCATLELMKLLETWFASECVPGAGVPVLLKLETPARCWRYKIGLDFSTR